jgi:hypothetical protein
MQSIYLIDIKSPFRRILCFPIYLFFFFPFMFRGRGIIQHDTIFIIGIGRAAFSCRIYCSSIVLAGLIID